MRVFGDGGCWAPMPLDLRSGSLDGHAAEEDDGRVNGGQEALLGPKPDRLRDAAALAALVHLRRKAGL